MRPVIDYALTRPEIDPDKIALAGWSFGGFLAPARHRSSIASPP